MKKEVGIAELKAHLSEYVRAASKGKEIVIKDRDTPIARLMPITERKLPFRIIPASLPCRGTQDMESISLSGVTPDDVDRALAETRSDRVEEWLNSSGSTSIRR